MELAIRNKDETLYFFFEFQRITAINQKESKETEREGFEPSVRITRTTD